MSDEIIVKKPKPIKFFGFALEYERYSKKQQFWMKQLPSNGDRIKITWFPSCRNGHGDQNPYIGMEGVVEDRNIDGDFVLNCGSCLLICPYSDFRYIKID